MITLGVNGAYHELAAAIVVDGVVIAAGEEERFNRRKHGAEARIDNADALPHAAIASCLSIAGVTADDIDAVCFSFDPEARRRDFRPDPFAPPATWGTPEAESLFRAGLARVPQSLSISLGRDVTAILRWVPHHIAHAASAYYASGFDSCAVMVIDGIGEHATAMCGRARGGRIEAYASSSYPDSLGFVWEKMSKYLGFDEYDAAKVMGLAAYGDPSRVGETMRSIVRAEAGGMSVNPAAFEFRRRDFRGLVERFGTAALDFNAKADIAAALQTVTNEIVLGMAREISETTHEAKLCFAGGLALNCTANWHLKESGLFDEFYVPCAPHDAGTAVGAALYQQFAHGDCRAVAATASSMRTAYTGPAFEQDAVLRAGDGRGFELERIGSPAKEAAQLIADGKVVGWFQGRMEFGPRALGNRSLLADPRRRSIRDDLNVKVKHRELFRPFAPSVLAEEANHWFQIGRDTRSYEHMAIAAPVRNGCQQAAPAIVHIDGTARLQAVSVESNPLFHQLISEFARITQVPMVLNTSFNDNEPIVCSPADAFATFAGTAIDALVIGDMIARRG